MSTFEATTAEAGRVSPHRLERLMSDPDCIVLDVRTPGEFDSAHIRDSHNVPLDRVERIEQLDTLLEGEVAVEAGHTLVLVCRSGNRASRAADALRARGVDTPLILDGGLLAWEREGLDVARGRERWSLERQVRLVAGLLVLVGVLGSIFLWAPLVWLAAFIGAGLAFAALTDTCTMGMLLSRLPYNRPRA